MLWVKTPWGPMPVSEMEHGGVVRITENTAWQLGQKVNTKNMNLRIGKIINHDTYWEAIVLDGANIPLEKTILGANCAETHDAAVQFINDEKLGIPKGFKVSPTPGVVDADGCALAWDFEDRYFASEKAGNKLNSYFVWIVPA